MSVLPYTRPRAGTKIARAASGIAVIRSGDMPNSAMISLRVYAASVITWSARAREPGKSRFIDLHSLRRVRLRKADPRQVMRGDHRGTGKPVRQEVGLVIQVQFQLTRPLREFHLLQCSADYVGSWDDLLNEFFELRDVSDRLRPDLFTPGQ